MCSSRRFLRYFNAAFNPRGFPLSSPLHYAVFPPQQLACTGFSGSPRLVKETKASITELCQYCYRDTISNQRRLELIGRFRISFHSVERKPISPGTKLMDSCTTGFFYFIPAPQLHIDRGILPAIYPCSAKSKNVVNLAR